MNFQEAVDAIKQIIPELQSHDYDGIVVKKLESSNTLDEGRTTNQTHIAITGEQMDIFPYVMADGYFGKDYDERNESLKKYYIAEIPIYIYEKNVEQLGSNDELIHFNNNEKKLVHSSVVRSRRNNAADQVQLSLINKDDTDFISFRKLIHTGDYLVILKHKEKLLFDFWGIKANNSLVDYAKLTELNNKFFNATTSTKIELDSMTNTDDNSNSNTIGANILFYGVPGSGKSHYIKTQYKSDEFHKERVVFHPDYSFADFVGQILPVTENGNINYKYIPGPFTNILKKAVEHPNETFYLIIEEINRGNAPAIFGDLFQLLDRDTTGESEYGITNYDIARVIYGDADSKENKIKIPSNLWLLATMNTSDQNVFTLDTAFQRRWIMKLIKNDISIAEHANCNIENSSIKWGDFAVVVNNKIIDANETNGGFGDKRLGAYFAKKDELSIDRFSGKVLKYLWDDAFKMNHNMIFSDSINSLELLIERFTTAVGDPLKNILAKEVYDAMSSRSNKSPFTNENESDNIPEA